FPWSPDEHMSASTKHPSGMPTIARRELVVFQPPSNETVRPGTLPRRQRTSAPSSTPHLRVDPSVLHERLQAVRTSIPHEPTIFAYSVKTNPDKRLVEEALRLGMCIEVISQEELSLSARIGARPDQLI